MGHELNPLNLQWKTLDFGMRNQLDPLDLQVSVTSHETNQLCFEKNSSYE